MYLLDTNIVSESSRPRPVNAVVHWLGATAPTSKFFSVASASEVRKGIELLRATKVEHVRSTSGSSTSCSRSALASCRSTSTSRTSGDG